MSAQNDRTPGASASAKIYQFPARGRFAGTQTEKAFPTVSIGDAWYHDEAMKEEQKARQH